MFAGPLDGDDIERLKSSNKVLGIFLANIFGSKVIDHEEEGDWMDGVV
jgi:hypothetical protein